ncbi:hypothetical protein [Pseudomonas lactis]|uniref:Uncharacterized protein n=1 Tax=Pseudomonas lactis TaxID=1615674 RepID=A0A7Y1MJG0_9PSED|nr:hypothetical protein [Pseudomonas lactis]KRP71412.1 hypothetical protein TX24_29230 [Pseudomonas lactis]NNA82970.1 hypothetical protein [Pseudomonas lactis]
MRGLITIALLLIVGRASAGEQVISVQHDSSRSVTCWITPQGGISCLPDSSLLQIPASTATDESQATRASLATSMCQSGQLPATPLPQDERFQL